MRHILVPGTKGVCSVFVMNLIETKTLVTKIFRICNEAVLLPLHHCYRYRYINLPDTIIDTVSINVTYLTVKVTQRSRYKNE
jgi:hypothetical protein